MGHRPDEDLQAQINGLTARAAAARSGRKAALARPAVAEQALLVDLLILRGDVLGCIADYERAAELAQVLVRDAPEDGAPWLARARTRAAFHRFAEALADLDAAGRGGADQATLDAERAAILGAVGCYAESLVLRRTAAERRPDFTTLGALAVLEAEGEVAQAERLFTEARRRYPWGVAVPGGLARLPARTDVARPARPPRPVPGSTSLYSGCRPTLRRWVCRAEVDAALGALRDAAINRLRPLAASSDDPVRGQPRKRPQRCRATRGGRAMAHERGGPLRRTGRAPSRGLRRSRGRILAHRGWRFDEKERWLLESHKPCNPRTSHSLPRHIERLMGLPTSTCTTG